MRSDVFLLVSVNFDVKITMSQTSLIQKYNQIHRTLDDIYENKDQGDLHFFLVGINDKSRDSKLNHCQTEAEKLISIFFECKNVRNKSVHSLFDSDATKNNIVSRLKHFQQTLRRNDKLIVYLAGYEYYNDFASFYMSFDSNVDNYHSCISTKFLFDTIKDYAAESILLFDCEPFEKRSSNLDLSDEAGFLQGIKTQETLPAVSNTLFHSLVDFMRRGSPRRTRQAFCILKDYSSPNTKVKEEWFPEPTTNFQNIIHKIYLDLLELYNLDQVPKLLNELSKILENNDFDLLSRVITLKYKWNQISADLKTARISETAYKEEVKVVKEIASEIVEQVNSNGFYLIKVPVSNLKELPEKKKIKILFTSASPRDQEFLRLNTEAREIEYELLKSKQRDQFDFIRIEALRPADLQDALLNHSPQFLHFSGHGNCDGIALLDDSDQTILVKSKPIAKLLGLFSKEIQCVFLNSCHSVSQSKEINKYINKVVCMSRAVPDELAIRFASSFYKSIGAGRNIDFSFEFAKAAIDLENINGNDIPLLLSGPSANS